MDIKRKAARGIAVLAVALGAGHLVQNMGEKKAPKAVASAELAQKPVKVETVAAGPAEVAPAITITETVIPPAAPISSSLQPVLPKIVALPQPAETVAPALIEPATVMVTPETVTQAEGPSAVASMSCDVTLDLMAEPNAMVGITLVAPCHPNQRVVLRQGGLAVTGQTTSTGAIFTSLPAFESQTIVEVSFADGTKAQSELAVPELATLRRFGVQWQADDAFQIHAFEGAAVYGDPGHVSGADPHLPAPGLIAAGGFLSLVGDSATDNPLLAEVYTFPADPGAKPEVVVEAAVTEKTCGRELLAETLTSTGGSVFVTDLTLVMPECDAIGDYLVLKNLVLDLNMAAAN
jgi:hypothetical protein